MSYVRSLVTPSTPAIWEYLFSVSGGVWETNPIGLSVPSGIRWESTIPMPYAEASQAIQIGHSERAPEMTDSSCLLAISTVTVSHCSPSPRSFVSWQCLFSLLSMSVSMVCHTLLGFTTSLLCMTSNNFRERWLVFSVMSIYVRSRGSSCQVNIHNIIIVDFAIQSPCDQSGSGVFFFM